MNGEEMGYFTEPARVLTKAMDDGDGTFRVFGSEPGVIKPNIGQFRRKVLFANGIVLFLELSEELIFLHINMIEWIRGDKI